MTDQIPAIAEAKSVVAEMREANSGCGKEAAKQYSKVLIGSYPSMNVDDPAVYARAIVSALADYPKSVCSSAVDKITREDKWPPTRARVIEVCDFFMSDRKAAINDRVREIKRAQEKQDAKKREKEVAEFREKFASENNGKTPFEVLNEKIKQGVKQQKE